MSAASPSKKQRLTMMSTPTRGLSQNRRDRIARMFKARDDVILVLTNTVATVSLCILGEPISQPRMRCYHSPPLGRVVVYDPTQDEKVAFQTTVRDAIAEVGATFPLFENDVKLKVTVTFHVMDMRKDIDNLLKFLLDALAKVMYNNDNMICSVVATKIMATRSFERTEFIVENIVEG
jgi:Holliday junction resolvase RusA-like endonuclease